MIPKPTLSARVTRGRTQNRLRVRKRALSPRQLPGYVSPRGARATPDDPTVAVAISMKASELRELDARAQEAGLSRSKWIALNATKVVRR